LHRFLTHRTIEESVQKFTEYARLIRAYTDDMILMNAILYFAPKERRAAYLVCAPVAFDNEHVAIQKSPTIQFRWRHFKETGLLD
jgi:hypothetical protein